MAVSNRYILHQGPVLGAIARAVWNAAHNARTGAATSNQVPGPTFTRTIPARPTDLVRDYVHNVGGDPGWYRGVVPAHLFPQWTFPLQARTLEGVDYPMQKALNFGCRMEIRAPLPLGEPFEIRAHLANIDDNGKRAILQQRTITSTPSHPEALIADVYAFVPLGRKASDAGPKSQRQTDDAKRSPGRAPGRADKNGSSANGRTSAKKTKPRVPETARELARWRIGTQAGLDFAKLTGDFNPIHWIAPAARAAGFRNVILHGFGTLARAVEGLNRGLFAGDPSRLKMIDVRFTRPLVLPAQVGLYIDGEQLFVGTAPGGPANLVGSFATTTTKTITKGN